MYSTHPYLIVHNSLKELFVRGTDLALKVLVDYESSSDSVGQGKRGLIEQQPSMITSACQGVEQVQ